MLYAEFRDQLEDALQEAGLFFHGVDRPVETIDLADTARRWKVYKNVSELATWIRYSPPPPGAKLTEPWFEDQSEDDDDGGPETIH